MKILFANKYFFPNGGTEVYLRILLDELPRLGHTCIPYSVAYAGSWPSEYAPYFLPPPVSAEALRLEHMRMTPTVAVKLAGRAIYSFAAKRHLERLLDHAGPVDAALALNIYNYMSPSILHTLARRGIPIAMQIGDYHLMCPNYQFLRDGRPCFLCQKGDYYNGLRYRCVKGSLAASGVRVLAMYVQRILRVWNLVDLFLVPCRFMRDRLVESGIRPERLRILPYAVRVPAEAALPAKGEYILSFGRVSREKGLDMLIRAYQMAAPDADLVILGRDYDGEQARLEALIAPEFSGRIRFLGFKGGAELSQWIGGALLSVVPSRWHDNAPLSVYESLGHATAVAAAAMGGIPEQIREGVDGVLFDPDDPQDLAAKLSVLLADKPALARMGRAGRERVLAVNDPVANAAELAGILSGLQESRRR